MKSRKYHVRQNRRTRRKQYGGIKCNEPASWAPIKYDANSCWLDTFLVALLHHPNEAIDYYIEYSILKYKRHEQYIKILKKIKKIRNRFRRIFSDPINEEALYKLRENIRNTISSCKDGDIFKKGEISSTDEIFTFISNIIEFPKTIIYNGDKNIDENRTNVIRLSPFDFIKSEKIILSSILNKYTHFNNLVPIDIERNDGMGGIIKTPLKLEENILLKTVTEINEEYKLVSVICNVGMHYVAYVSCDLDDNWYFYNDINPIKTRMTNVGALKDWWDNPIPGYKSKKPTTHATWLLYIKNKPYNQLNNITNNKAPQSTNPFNNIPNNRMSNSSRPNPFNMF